MRNEEFHLLFCFHCSGHDKVVEILLRNGANVNAESNARLTALHYAAAEGMPS